MNSRANSTHRGRRRYERGLSLFLYNCQQCVEILDPILGQLDRRHQPLVRRRYSLTHLLHVDAYRRRDVVHVVGDRARMPHDRIDVAVNPVHHVADLRVALSEVPRRRHESDGENEQRDRRQSAGVGRDLAEQTWIDLHLFGDDRIGQGAGSLKQPV